MLKLHLYISVTTVATKLCPALRVVMIWENVKETITQQFDNIDISFFKRFSYF